VGLTENWALPKFIIHHHFPYQHAIFVGYTVYGLSPFSDAPAHHTADYLTILYLSFYHSINLSIYPSIPSHPIPSHPAGSLLLACARVPVDRGCARVPVCPCARVPGPATCYLSIYLSVCLPACLAVCLSVRLSVCLSVCLCVNRLPQRDGIAALCARCRSL